MVTYNPSSVTRLAVLGSGTPNPDPLRNGPALLLLVEGVPYLFDFGPGVVRQAAALSGRYGGELESFEVKDLSTAFLTHLHADHTMGLPDLILTPWIMGRGTPLRLYGPGGTAALVEGILQGYRTDIQYRLEGLEPANPDGWQVEMHEFQPGQIFRDPGISVEAFPVEHGRMPDCYGFRITTPDRTIVFSGDTQPCPGLLEKSRGVDYLVHEVYSSAGLEGRSHRWQKYHRAHHTSGQQVAALAREVNPRLLILVHALSWGVSEQALLAEVRAGYKGKVALAEDLQVF